jgi:hypothetical protein
MGLAHFELCDDHIGLAEWGLRGDKAPRSSNGSKDDTERILLSSVTMKVVSLE